MSPPFFSVIGNLYLFPISVQVSLANGVSIQSLQRKRFLFHWFFLLLSILFICAFIFILSFLCLFGFNLFFLLLFLLLEIPITELGVFLFLMWAYNPPSLFKNHFGCFSQILTFLHFHAIKIFLKFPVGLPLWYMDYVKLGCLIF